jgi:hypothetical protein
MKCDLCKVNEAVVGEGNKVYCWDCWKSVLGKKKGNAEEFYCVKAQKYLGKVVCIPCQDCKKAFWDPKFVSDMDNYCLRYCQYNIIEDLLSEEQKRNLVPASQRFLFGQLSDLQKRGVKI